jgi:hypothetical protein
LSLGIITAVIAISVILSLLFPNKQAKAMTKQSEVKKKPEKAIKLS